MLGQSATMDQPLIPGLPDAVADHCLLRVAYDHLSLLHSVCRRWRHLLRSADFQARRRLAGITRPLLLLHVQEFHTSCKSYVTLFDPVSGTWRLLNRANEVLLSITRSSLRYPFISVPGVSCTWRIYAIGEDGNIFCCHGGKLRVKKRGEDGWRELADLPSNVENCLYLTSWKGGVLVAGTISEGVRGDYNPPLNVYTLMLEENDPTPPTWIAQSLPDTGSEGVHAIQGIWLEI